MNTHLNMFGTKCDFGEGIIDFDELMPVLAEAYDGVWWAVDSIPMGAKAWQDTWNGHHHSQRRCSTSTSAEGRRRAMKAAVFYDVEDIRLEDVPEPEAGRGRRRRRGARPAASAAPTSSTTTAAARVGTADGKGPLVLGHEFSRPGRQVGMVAEQTASPRATGWRVNPDPVSATRRPLPLRQPALRTCTVLGVTTNGGFAEYVAHEDRARLQAARLDERRAGRLRRDALAAVGERGREGRDRARRPRRRLRPGPGRALDGAAR